MKAAATEIKQYLLDSLFLDFGFIIVTPELENWPSLSWTQFKEALQCQEIDIEKSINRQWKSFFIIEKEKFLLLQDFSGLKSYLTSVDLMSTLYYN
jgi:hypothetical protein